MIGARAAQRAGARTGVQRGYVRVSSRTVFTGNAVLPTIDQDCTGERRQALGRSGGCLLQPRQCALSCGSALEKSAPQEAIQKWTEAVKAYDTALQLRADDADSKYNRDFVNRKIDALRKPPDQGGGGGGGGGGQGQGKGQGQGQGHGAGASRHIRGNRRQGNREAQGPPPGRRSSQAGPQQSPPQSPKHGAPPPDQRAGRGRRNG